MHAHIQKDSVNVIECYVYFVLRVSQVDRCYWCAIKIFVLFFAISAGRRKSQKTKPGPAPLNVQGCRRLGKRYANMGAEGQPGKRDDVRRFGSLAPDCYVYFVLSPAGAGLIMLLVCNQNIRFVFCDFRR